MKTLVLSLSLVMTSLFGAQYRKEQFTKVCNNCKCISYEIQNYAYNEWNRAWEPSWRSDSERPNLCLNCFNLIRPVVHYLEPPKKSYIVSSYTSKDLQDLSIQYFKAQAERQNRILKLEQDKIDIVRDSNRRLLRFGM